MNAMIWNIYYLLEKRLLNVTLDLLVRGENVHKWNGIMLCNTIITVHK